MLSACPNARSKGAKQSACSACMALDKGACSPENKPKKSLNGVLEGCLGLRERMGELELLDALLLDELMAGPISSVTAGCLC